MKNKYRRGFLATIGAVAAGVTLTFGGAVAAQATPSAQPVPDSSNVVITKCEQPESLGNPATGEEQVALSCTGINGVVFDYYLVPETWKGGTNDIGTNKGQEYAAGLTVATAEAVAGFPQSATGSFPATEANTGTTTVNALPRGLYVIKESATPAGVTAAVPFLLAVPMTDPTDLDKWLDTIYVYPKNAKIEASKSVENATDYVVGDKVTWTIETAIPRVANPDYKKGVPGSKQFLAPDAFQVWDVLTDAELAIAAEDTKTDVKVTAPAGLTVDTDYTVTVTPALPNAGQSTVKIAFTDDGLKKLADQVNKENPVDTINVSIDTKVMKSGVIKNKAQIYSNAESLPTEDKPSGNPLVTGESEIRYGNFNVKKVGTDGTDLVGAEFKVYLTKQAAIAGGTDNLKPTGQTGTWVTDSSGGIDIRGLRDSDWANGVAVTPGEANYQTYWLVETKAPTGYQLLAEPVEFTVTQNTGKEIPWTYDLTVTNAANSGGFSLPLTGGTGTLLLTVGGIALLGTVLIVARRRRASASAE